MDESTDALRTSCAFLDQNALEQDAVARWDYRSRGFDVLWMKALMRFAHPVLFLVPHSLELMLRLVLN